MDLFHIKLQQEMDIQIISSNNEIEDKFGDEDDDVFYGELRRQVLQLITDEEEDGDEDYYENKNPNLVEARKQGTKDRTHGVLKPICYYNWPGNMEDCVAPAWILNLWRTGNGTGVFIPQVLQSRRRNRPRRKKSGGGRTYKQVEKRD